jgi:transcriptional regulator with XRE-family HTH domain
MEQEFITWLTEQMYQRGWNNSELARRANIVPSTVSMVLSGQNRPGLDFCVSIAQAFQEPPEKILRQAGLLPPLPGPEEDIRFRDVLEILKRLTSEERDAVLEYANWRLQKQEAKREIEVKDSTASQAAVTEQP